MARRSWSRKVQAEGVGIEMLDRDDPVARPDEGRIAPLIAAMP
jgi:hypothetical protein